MASDSLVLAVAVTATIACAAVLAVRPAWRAVIALAVLVAAGPAIAAIRTRPAALLREE